MASLPNDKTALDSSRRLEFNGRQLGSVRPELAGGRIGALPETRERYLSSALFARLHAEGE